jgi:hypothetical protein
MFDMLTLWVGQYFWKCVKKMARFPDREIRFQIITGVSLSVCCILVFIMTSIVTTMTMLTYATTFDYIE